MPNSKQNVNWVPLIPWFLLFSFSVSFLSVAFSVWWVRVSLLWQVCFVVTRVIDRTVCLRATEWCSWKYISCNFSCVNIAGSLVKQRDKWYWERKCCLFWKQKKNIFSLSFFLYNESWDDETGRVFGCICPTSLQKQGKPVTGSLSHFLIEIGWFGYSLISETPALISLDSVYA